ncbi:uncharacterized protein TNCV_337391 [Trichonephila clavipes]|nr:uncharacterized protein TNCV_337391 [Trichonephila clavipes]
MSEEDKPQVYHVQSVLRDICHSKSNVPRWKNVLAHRPYVSMDGCGTVYNKLACSEKILSTKFPYVIICSTSGLEKLCFGHKDHKDRLLFCNDARRRVCFNQGLSICKIPNFNEPKIRRRRIAELSESDDPRKPDVNCQNCEVDIKMFVREGEENATPKILINITDIDPVDVLMDDSDDDNDV